MLKRGTLTQKWKFDLCNHLCNSWALCFKLSFKRRNNSIWSFFQFTVLCVFNSETWPRSTAKKTSFSWRTVLCNGVRWRKCCATAGIVCLNLLLNFIYIYNLACAVYSFRPLFFHKCSRNFFSRYFCCLEHLISLCNTRSQDEHCTRQTLTIMC